MKTSVASAFAALVLTLHASTAPAVQSTLASYLALGSSGATIGSTLFSDFTLEPNQAGATPIPTSILVTPIDLFGLPTLEFAVMQSAAAGELFELKLSYKVQDIGLVGAEVALATVTATGDGAVTGTLDLTGPAPQPATLIAFATANDAELFAQASFFPTPQLVVQTSFVVDGGLAGQGSGQVLHNQFTVVPEPTVTLLGLSALALWAGTRARPRRA